MTRILSIVIWAGILVITALRIFPNLDSAPIRTWDESTNIAVIENTRSANSFFTLYYQNEPFFEKPPLWYWFVISVRDEFKDAVTAGRAISAVAGFLLIGLTTWISWRWWGWVGGLGAWIVLLSTNHLYMTNPAGSFSTHTFRSADTDSLHMFFLMCSYISANYLLRKPTALIAGVAAGLSVLSKSPIGLLPLLVATVFTHNKSERQHVGVAWLACAVTLLPWYLWMVVQFGSSFIWSHLGYHVAARISMPLEGHDKPMWYYMQILMNRHFFLSWEWLTASAVYLYLKRKIMNKQMKFACIMVACTLAIPTLTATKLAWYILPFYPFAALVMGGALSTITQTLLSRHWNPYKTSRR